MSGPAELGHTANSYAILAKLATGGMAEIFLARNASGAGIERYVVLKRVLSHKANDQTFVQMFLDEARLAAQLQHPNIAQVYDTGVLGDSYFFTMEYVHGETVREMLHRAHATKRAIPTTAVMTVIAAAAAGLHHAHTRKGLDGKPLGIVHRDVSPSNLMVSFEGNVKVVDFGVAKATHRRTETQSGTVKGKIAYLSPEQCRGRAIDRRSDLFSLGIVMWEMLVGDRLFKFGTDYEIMEAIVTSTPPPPSKRRADVPEELDAIVAKLLARDPDDRYQTGDEVLEAVEAAAVRIGVSLSSSALGRFVRETVGERPEPWIEMQAAQEPAEIVTVTAAPTIGPPDTSELDAALDSQLAKLPGLPSRSFTRTPTPLPFQAVEVEAKTTSSPSYTPYPNTGSYSSVDSSPALPAHRRKRALVYGIAGAALVAGIGIVMFTRGGGGGEQSTAPVEAPNPAAAPARAPDKIEAPPPAEPVTATTPETAKPKVLATKPKVEPARPKVEPTPPKLEPTKPKVEAAKPKVEATKPRSELLPPKDEATPPVTKPKPKDCDTDPMSCRR